MEDYIPYFQCLQNKQIIVCNRKLILLTLVTPIFYGHLAIRFPAENAKHVLPSERKIKTMGHQVNRNQEHTVEEAKQILWKTIDEAKMYMQDANLNSDEKRRWARILADTIGVLNKLLNSQGSKELEDEDLGTLLAKIPRTMRLAVVKRARTWRKKNS